MLDKPLHQFFKAEKCGPYTESQVCYSGAKCKAYIDEVNKVSEQYTRDVKKVTNKAQTELLAVIDTAVTNKRKSTMTLAREQGKNMAKLQADAEITPVKKADKKK